MNERAVRRVSESLVQSIFDSGDKFASLHLADEEGMGAPSNVADVKRSLTWAVEDLAKRKLRYRAAIAVPLGVTDELRTRLPGVRTWKVIDEPPSLYVFGPHFSSWQDAVEEYRCAYTEAEVQVDRLWAEYSCRRDVEHRVRGWEFSMTLWFSLREN